MRLTKEQIDYINQKWDASDLNPENAYWDFKLNTKWAIVPGGVESDENVQEKYTQNTNFDSDPMWVNNWNLRGMKRIF